MTTISVRFRSAMRRIWAELRQYPITCGVMAAVVLCVGTVLWRIDPLEWRLRSAAERQDRMDLQEIGAALRRFAEEHRDSYPPTTLAPEFGLPDLAVMKEYLEPRLASRLTDTSKPRLCYLGYLLADDVSTLQLLDSWQRQGASADPSRDVILGSVEDDTREPAGARILRLKQGLERYFCVEVMGVNEGALIQSRIPLLWELPTVQRLGGFVVFIDGHVKWAAYPGGFPMSDSVANALRHFIDEPGARHTPRQTSPVADIAEKLKHYVRPYYVRESPVYGRHILQCDIEPGVIAGNARGYRIVFGTEEKSSTFLSGVSIRRPNPDGEFLLFPETDPAPAKRAIHWITGSRWFGPTGHYLGDGLGYHWFANAGVEDTDDLRAKLALKGGDDRAEILEESMNVFRTSRFYADRCALRLADAGKPEKAAAYFEKELSGQSNKERRRALILNLGAVNGDLSTKLLLEFYHSPDRADADAAALALVTPPFRPEAKDVYLGMLEQPEAWPEALDAAARFTPREAEPIARSEYQNATTFHVFCHAYRALRAIEGRPAPKELENATAWIKRSDVYGYQPVTADFRILRAPELQTARDVVLQTADREAAIIFLLDIVVPHMSAPYADTFGRLSLGTFGGINEIAGQLLTELPRQSVVDVLERVSENVRESGQVSYLQRLCVLMKSDAPASKLFRDEVLWSIWSQTSQRMRDEIRDRNWR